MRKSPMRNALGILMLTLLLPLGLGAQSISPEVYGSAGTVSTAGTIEVSWTIGEPLTETLAGSNEQVSQGFHQPRYVLVALDEPFAGELVIDVFPNPASEQVFVEFERDGLEDLTVELVDMQGRILREVSTAEQRGKLEINLSNVALGSYFLRVRSGQRSYDAYKIQKIN